MTTMTRETAILIDNQIVTWTAHAILAMFRTQIMKLVEKPKTRCLETHKWENKRKQKVF